MPDDAPIHDHPPPGNRRRGTTARPHAIVPNPSPRALKPHRALRSAAFAIADCAFLGLVGAISLIAMHAAHMLEWPFLVEMLIGMIVAMVAQIALAWLVAPLLGSIESMTPSMLVAMIAPMAVCLGHAMGSELEWPACLIAGFAAGVLALCVLSLYGAHCRRMLADAWPEGRAVQ